MPLVTKSKVVSIKPEAWDGKELRKIDDKIEIRPGDSCQLSLKVQSILQDKVFEAQHKEVELDKVKIKVKLGIETQYQILDDGMIVMGR